MIDPTKPFRIVLISEGVRDPALDMTLDQLAEYAKTRDESLLRFKEGKTPTWLHVQRVGKLALATIVDSTPAVSGESGRHIRAFRLGCPLVEPSPDVFPDAKGTWEPDPKRADDVGEGIRMAGLEWFERVANEMGTDAVYETADVIRQHASLPARCRGPFAWRPGSGVRA